MAVPPEPADAFDPQRAYYPSAFELLRCCLLRTLYSYNGRPGVDGGTEIQPDLATGAPSVSADGRTWTIHLRTGLHYAPPFQGTEITAGDIVRALLREGNPAVQGPYSFYYSIIQGFSDYQAGKTQTISGLETPDPHTLVVRLTQASGDLQYRLALAATAPIPPEGSNPLGAAQGHDQGFGPYLVGSGPYMFAGSEKLNFGLPPERQPTVAGYTPNVFERLGHATLVRNPSWHAADDALRAASPDRIELTAVQMDGAANQQKLEEDLAGGGVDLAMAEQGSTLGAYERVAGHASAARTFHESANSESFFPLNLAVPPFDDIAVRKAVALAIDRQEMAKLLGQIGSPSAPAWHAAPDPLEGELLTSYRPLPVVTGDLKAAKAAMAMSRYDRNHDGVCDASACSNIEAVAPFASEGFPPFAEEVQKELAPLGLRFDVHELAAPGVSMGDPTNHLAFNFIPQQWLSDYPSGSGWYPLLFLPSGTTPGQNFDRSLLGSSPQQLRQWGYKVSSVPSANARIDGCLNLIGNAESSCWAGVDQYLMQSVVPMVPLAVGQFYQVAAPRITSMTFDQGIGEPALDRVVVAPNSPPPVASPSPPAGTGSLPTLSKRCGSPGPSARVFRFPAADGTPLDGALTGTGPTGVLLVAENGFGICGWWPYAGFLAQHGFQVMLFNYRCFGLSSCPAGAYGGLSSDLAGAVSYLRSQGSSKVFLVGASMGATLSIVGGTQVDPPVAGVVGLSPPPDLNAFAGSFCGCSIPVNATTAASKLRIPLEVYVARGDPEISVAVAQHIIDQAHTADKRLVVLPSKAGHGLAYIGGPGAWSEVALNVLAWLRSRAGG